MPAQIVFFDPKGGPISVEIRCGYAQDGAYILTLWGENKIIERFEGNFLDPHDDTHKFAGTPSSHAGQLIQCRAEVGITPPITRYAVIMTIWQNDMAAGVLTTTGDETVMSLVTINLFARLQPRL
jgi:hypothetical protein